MKTAAVLILIQGAAADSSLRGLFSPRALSSLAVHWRKQSQCHLLVVIYVKIRLTPPLLLVLMIV